jgi:putative tryptophan/tyrosine transport system substrate-binding protein
MRRRKFIVLVGGAAVAWPHAVIAQQPVRMRRIGVVMGYAESDPNGQLQVAAFRQQLERLGWVEGSNIRIDFRFAADAPERIRALALELLGLGPDMMVSNSNVVTTILQSEVRAIPLVFVSVSDPIGSGFVTDLARPTGNVTGFANFQPTMGSKWLDILRQIVPQLESVGLLLRPEPPNIGYLKSAEAAAPSFNIKLVSLAVESGTEIEGVLAKFAVERRAGLIVAPNVVTFANSDRIIGLAAQHRLPAIYPFAFFETTEIRHSIGWCSSRLAARGKRAATGATSGRVCPRRVGRFLCALCGRVPQRPQRNRLRRGSKRDGRVPLDGGPI